MAETVVETAVYRLRVEGQDQIDRMTKSIEGLAVAEEDATKATRTTSDELQKRIARYDPLIRAQQAYSKELQNIARYQETGVGTQQEINALFEGATARYQAATKATQELGGAHAGLSGQAQAAMHAMRSMAEMIATGVSPIRAAALEMSRLSYAASGEGGIAGAFKQAGGMLGGMAETARSFITPMNLAIGAVVTFGMAAVTAAAQWLTAQKEIERSLLGIGARSGATASSLRAFSEGGGVSGLSVGQRRDAATEFTRTGDIDVGKLRGLSEAVEGYSIITGKTAVEASKALAQALSGDLSQGIQDLGKVYGTLNPVLQQTVDTLLKMGETAKAQQTIIDAVAAENNRATATLGPLAKGWEMVGNAASFAADMLGKVIFAQGQAGQARQARRESAAQAAGFGQRDDLIAAKGQAAVESVEPQIAQLRKLEQALFDVQKAKAGIGATGPIPPLIDQGAEEALRKQIEQLKQASSETVKLATETATQSAKNVAALGDAATAAEKAQARIDALSASFQNGQITADIYARAVSNIRDQLSALSDQGIPTAGLEQMKNTLADITALNKQYAGSSKDVVDLIGDTGTALNKVGVEGKVLYDDTKGTADQIERGGTAAEWLAEQMKRVAERTAIVAQNLAAGADSAVSINYSFLTSQNLPNTGSTKPGSGGWNASFAGGAFDVPGSGPGGGMTGVSVSTLDPWTMSLFQNPMQAPSYSDLVSQAMLGGTGSALAFAMGQQAHGQVAQMIPGFGGQLMPTGGVAAQAVTESDIIGQVQSLFQLQQSQTSDKSAQAQSMQAELAWLQSRPQSLQQQQAIVSLKQSIEQLTKSTDSLNATNQELLSPYYTQDPRTSHIGFRSQGMALGGYVDVPGGVSSNDNMIATIPVASGERIYIDPMTNRRGSGGGSGNNSIVINSPINIYGNADKDQFGRTLYQTNQALAKQIATVR